MEKIEELINLIYDNLFDEAKSFITNNGNINLNGNGRNGRTPLLVAINKDNLDFVEFLILNGADVNYGGTYILPLEEAIETAANRLDFSKTKKVDINVIDLLLKYNADVTQKDKEGETPLIFLKRYFGFDDMQEFRKYYSKKIVTNIRTR